MPRARHWFRKLIDPYRLACSVDDCVLLVSELATNAILYGRSDEEWVVRVEWFREGPSLRVEVHNPGLPASVRLRHPDADDAHGRGLLLVDAIATSWNYGPSRFGGTVVSFELAGAWPSCRCNYPRPLSGLGGQTPYERLKQKTTARRNE